MGLFEEFVIFKTEISEFLSTILIESSFFYVNLWSLVHFFTGGILMFILIRYNLFKKYSKLCSLFVLVVLYELFELFIIYTGLNFGGLFEFKIEIFSDIVLDIILAMVAGFLVLKNKKFFRLSGF